MQTGEPTVGRATYSGGLSGGDSELLNAMRCRHPGWPFKLGKDTVERNVNRRSAMVE